MNLGPVSLFETKNCSLFIIGLSFKTQPRFPDTVPACFDYLRWQVVGQYCWMPGSEMSSQPVTPGLNSGKTVYHRTVFGPADAPSLAGGTKPRHTLAARPRNTSGFCLTFHLGQTRCVSRLVSSPNTTRPNIGRSLRIFFF